MSLYLLLKWIHVLSSVLLVGTGFGSAYYLYFTNRGRVLAAQAEVCRLVIRADWWFTTPAAIVQPVSGLALAQMAGYPLTTPWLLCAILLYLLAGACWLPVVWLQIRMGRMANDALRRGTELPPQYWRHARLWEALGYPAFVAMLVVYALMLAKPALWA